jgi:hypothetical protein
LSHHWCIPYPESQNAMNEEQRKLQWVQMPVNGSLMASVNTRWSIDPVAQPLFALGHARCCWCCWCCYIGTVTALHTHGTVITAQSPSRQKFAPNFGHGTTLSQRKHVTEWTNMNGKNKCVLLPTASAVTTAATRRYYYQTHPAAMAAMAAIANTGGSNSSLLL